MIAQAPAGELDHRVHRLWLLIALLSASGVMAGIVLAALQAQRLARPLEAIARRAAQLGDGDFSVRAGHFGIPEVDAIAGGLDSSAGRIAELIAHEREFSANVSHQLRTPLTALRLRLEEAHGYGDQAGTELDLNAALAEADRLEATIADLLVHARQAGDMAQIVVNVGAVTKERAATWQPIFTRARRKLEVNVAKNILVRASPGTVGQVIDVLLDNALHHGQGDVHLGVWRDDLTATLAVGDDGPGIAPLDRTRIFERGASHAGGTGIGLHLARALLEADRGTLDVAPGDSTRFIVRLPLLATSR